MRFLLRCAGINKGEQKVKYRVQLVNNRGDIIDESTGPLSAANAIGLIRAWESIILTLRGIAVESNKPNEVEPDHKE